MIGRDSVITNETSWSVLGLAVVGLVIVLLAGIALLAVLVDELVEIGWAVPKSMQAYLACRESWQAWP
jgi:hypothetical protein